MGEGLVAPSAPNNKNQNQQISEKKKNKSFLNKLFSKKKKEKTEFKPEGFKPKQETLDQIEEKHFSQKQGTHPLDHINKIDKDLQIDHSKINIPENKTSNPNKESKHSSLNSIEDVSFNDNHAKEQDDSFNINQLRKAIGIIKDKSEKEKKIELFKNSLEDEIKEEGEIITDLSLEEKLDYKLNPTPTELIERLKIGITMDSEVPEENTFVLADGRRLKSLRDLRNTLENMSEGTFKKHVYGRKNDFANWIKKIFNEPELANITRKCKSIETLLSMLVTLEKKEIRELIKLKEKEIIKEHKDSLKDLTVRNDERKELEEERTLVDKLRKEYEEKLNELEREKQEVNKEEEKTKIDLETEKEKEQQLEDQKKRYLKLIKSESGSLNNLREELIEEIQKNQEKLNQDFLKRKKQLEREYQIKQDRLKFEREQFTREQQEANSLYHTKLKELRVEEEKIYSLQKELKEQELRLIEKENRVRQTLSQLSEKLVKSKELDSKLEKDIEDKNKLLLEIKQKEVDLRQKKRNLEKEGFKTYIDSELKKLSASEEEKKIKIKATDEDISLIYHLIDSCRKFIKAKKIDEAKTAYKGVRETYYGLNLSKEDEELIFNAIRELYADIKLSTVPND